MKVRNEGWESTHGLMAENMKVSTKMIKIKEDVGAVVAK